MKKQIEIETDRLILRRWQENDLEPFIAMNKDAEVMRYFPSVLTAKESKELYNIATEEFSDVGYSMYAAEEKKSGNFIGFIGFHRQNMDVDFCPCVEIGWRLDKKYWNKGYATEGAKACLKHGFEKLKFKKIYSFTSIKNKPSKRVMQKLGLKLHEYFDNPMIADGHPLKPHVCYCIESKEYLTDY